MAKISRICPKSEGPARFSMHRNPNNGKHFLYFDNDDTSVMNEDLSKSRHVAKKFPEILSLVRRRRREASEV